MSKFNNDGIGYTSAAAVTPNNSTELDINAFFVGVGGDVAIQTASMAAAVTLKNCISGVIYPIQGKAIKIMSTNTTATNIVGLV